MQRMALTWQVSQTFGMSDIVAHFPEHDKMKRKDGKREGKTYREDKSLTLPNDPVILYSMLNTKLRDQYVSLTELCDDLDIGEQEILGTMTAAGYVYDAGINQFRRKG